MCDPRPGGWRLGVHGFGTEQQGDLVSMNFGTEKRGDLVSIVLVLSNGIFGKHSEIIFPYTCH